MVFKKTYDESEMLGVLTSASSIKEVAEHFHMTRDGVYKLMKKLEEQGVIRRSICTLVKDGEK